MIEIKHGYAFKGQFFTDQEHKHVLLTPGNFKIGGGFNSSKFKYYLGEVPPDYVLTRNDLIVTMTDLSKGGDTLGYPALVPHIRGKVLLHNQRLGKVVLRNNNLFLKNYLFFSMRSDPYRSFVLGGATGSTVKHTSPKRICDYATVLPDAETLRIFDTVTNPLLAKEQENLSECGLLGQVRDLVLPRLISGKLHIDGINSGAKSPKSTK